MTNKLLKNSTALYALLALGLMALFVRFSVQCYYADSEIWLLTVSQKLLHVDGLVTIYYKWSFHALIYLFSHFAPSELEVYSWARIGCAGIGLAAAALTALVYTQVFENRKMFFPLLIFIITSSLFFNQAFRIRADIFSYFFHILIVWFLLRMRTKPILWWHHVLLFGLNLLLLASSPKMIYFFIAQFFLAVLISFKIKSPHKKEFFWFVWLGHFSCIAVLSLAGTAAFFTHELPNAPLALSLAVDFFVSKFHPVASGPEFGSTESFQHFTHFLVRSWLHVLIFILALAGLVFRKLFRDKTSEPSLQTSLLLYSFVLLFFALIHNDKLPFFLAPMMMPLTAWSLMVFVANAEKIMKNFLSSTLIIIIAICSYQALTQYQLNHFYNTNFFQQGAIKKLDNYVEKHPGIKIYDVVGLLPRKNTIFAFVGPGEEREKQQLVDSIKDQDPDIIIYTFKASRLEPQLGEYLVRNRIPVEEDVWTKGRAITLTSTPEYFQTTRMIKGRRYWVLPTPQEKYIYDLKQKRMINAQVLRLNAAYQPAPKNPHFIAIPMEFIFLGLSNFGPPEFIAPPGKVFRFDTGF